MSLIYIKKRIRKAAKGISTLAQTPVAPSPVNPIANKPINKPAPALGGPGKGKGITPYPSMGKRINMAKGDRKSVLLVDDIPDERAGSVRSQGAKDSAVHYSGLANKAKSEIKSFNRDRIYGNRLGYTEGGRDTLNDLYKGVDKDYNNNTMNGRVNFGRSGPSRVVTNKNGVRQYVPGNDSYRIQTKPSGRFGVVNGTNTRSRVSYDKMQQLKTDNPKFKLSFNGGRLSGIRFREQQAISGPAARPIQPYRR